MTRISPRHPRYASLRVRARLAQASRNGRVAPEGLIAHGRGEAFDYFLGERTIPSALRAERMAARWLLRARRPVVSVNGNVAELAAPQIAALAVARPGLRVEVNLFHRTRARARAIAQLLTAAGVREVYGVSPTARIPGLPSDRGFVDRRGILRADVCLVPLEDGDRAEALQRLGKRVISIDLNPFSRTSRTADLPIVDELTRALTNILEELGRARPRQPIGPIPRFGASGTLTAARRAMARTLLRRPPPRGTRASARASPRRARGTRRRSRRRP